MCYPALTNGFRAAYYDPNAGVYYDFPTGSDSVPDGIDFVGDPNFEAVFFDGGLNSGPNGIIDVGDLSPYGTAGQGGNVTEWEESSANLLNDSTLAGRGFRGGAWGNISSHLHAGNRNAIGPALETDFFGFRVVSIPEPRTFSLLVLGLIGLAGIRTV